MSKKIKPKSEQKVSDKFVVSSYSIEESKNATPSMRGVKKTNKIFSRRMSISSKSWLQRQMNDPYVKKAKELGYRSRACFKILEIDSKYGIIKNAKSILDLGAAPGGWTQICRNQNKQAKIIALDILEMEGIAGTHFVQGNFLEAEVKEQVKAISQSFDLIISDIAPNTTGNNDMDHLRILEACYDVFEFSQKFLQKDGNLVVKLFMGSGEADFIKALRAVFEKVSYFKPSSSRKESKEVYLMCFKKLQ